MTHKLTFNLFTQAYQQNTGKLWGEKSTEKELSCRYPKTNPCQACQLAYQCGMSKFGY
jgi:hypothetical protein